MPSIEDVESDDLMLLANDILKQYNSIRHELHSKCFGYYNQSMSSNYYKEDDLIELLERCKKIKETYKKVSEILMSRGYRFKEKGWSAGNGHLFASAEILHFA